MAERLARELRSFLPELPPVTFHRQPWQERLNDAGDLAIFGNVLNEEGNAPPPDTIGAEKVALIEPGTLASFTVARRFRDAMAADGWGIDFPCPQFNPCPMRSDDWCHFRINRFALPFIQRIAGRAKRLNPRHHFTGFLFSRDAREAPEVWRVLSAVRKAHRSGIRYLCGGDTVIETVLNRRARTPENRLFLEADIGDALRIVPQQGRQALTTTRRIAAGDRITPWP